MPNWTLVNIGAGMFFGVGLGVLLLAAVLSPGLFAIFYVVYPGMVVALIGLFLAIAGALMDEPRPRIAYRPAPSAPVPAFCERCGTRLEWNVVARAGWCPRCKAVRWSAPAGWT